MEGSILGTQQRTPCRVSGGLIGQNPASVRIKGGTVLDLADFSHQEVATDECRRGKVETQAAVGRCSFDGAV